jgi:ABC-type bacteriocin/lantibiotic exporter with double-glycine peptidase domain
MRLFLLFFILPVYSFDTKESDHILKNLNPPSEYWEVEGGSCGEACIFSITEYLNQNISQKNINKLATKQNRGMYSNELIHVLKKLNINFKNISSNFANKNEFIQKLTNVLDSGNPIILGVKIYPDENPKWACDHFILIVGYNKTTNELIYNSNDSRERIKIKKILNKENGYSILHKSNYIFAIEIILKDKIT